MTNRPAVVARRRFSARRTSFTLVLAAVGTVAAPAHADVALEIEPGAFDGIFPAAGTTHGWQFTVNARMNVTHLGLYDKGLDGFAIDHPIGLWDEDGTLLVEDVISAGAVNPLIENFRYVDITGGDESADGVSLSPRITYTIGFYSATAAQSDGMIVLDDVHTFHPAVNYAGFGVSAFTDGLEIPIDDDRPDGTHRFGPNFQFVIIEGLDASVDIKPGSCPNPMNPTSNGVLPVALLGSDTIDVTMVDLATITISRADGIGGSLAPNFGPPGPSPSVEDVGTPFDGKGCDCHDLEGDGTLDLMLHFWTSDLVDALEIGDGSGTAIELVISGELLDGSAFAGSDCVCLVPCSSKGDR